MTFLTMMGGLVAFGFLWLFFPRASFAIVLALYLKYQHGALLFPDGGQEAHTWDIAATLLFMLVGVIVGVILDIIEHKNATKNLD